MYLNIHCLPWSVALEHNAPLSRADGDGLKWEVRLSSRRLCAHLGIGVSMDNPPSICLVAKHHRHPQFLGRQLNPASDTETDHFLLYDIREVATDGAPNFLAAPGAIRVFRAGPIEPRSHLVLSRLHATESAAKTDLVTVGPQRCERGGATLNEFMFCGLKPRHERNPFRIG